MSSKKGVPTDSTSKVESTTVLRIMLVGKTGDGKSSTGNSLLGREAFKTSKSSKSVTQTVSLEEATRFGMKIEVTDTPGFFDTGKDNVEIEKQMFKSMAATIPGFHAILFVVRAGRFTEELKETADLLINGFGGNCSKFAFVVLTDVDTKEEKNQYLVDAEPKLKELMELCQGKVLFINNKNKDGKEELARGIIETIAKHTSGKYYESKMYTEVASRLADKKKITVTQIQTIVIRREIIEDSDDSDDSDDEDDSVMEFLASFFMHAWLDIHYGRDIIGKKCKHKKSGLAPIHHPGFNRRFYRLKPPGQYSRSGHYWSILVD